MASKDKIVSFDKMKNLLNVIKNPYKYQENIKEYQISSQPEKKYQTFCGT